MVLFQNLSTKFQVSVVFIAGCMSEIVYKIMVAGYTAFVVFFHL